MENKFIPCTYKTLMTYVEKHNLTHKSDGMNSYWIDSEGNEKARSQHGFAFDEYHIWESVNYETTSFVNSIINKY